MVEVKIDEFSHNVLSGWVAVEPDEHFPSLKLYMNDQFLGEIDKNASQPKNPDYNGWTYFRYAFEFHLNGLLSRVPQNAVLRLVRGSDGSLIREIAIKGQSAESRFANSFGEGYALYPKGAKGFVVPLKERSHSWWESVGEGLKSLYASADASGYDLQIAYGSLLGCIREESFVPHDDDIDLVLHCGEQDNVVAAAIEFRKRLHALAGPNPVRVDTNGQGHINFRFERDVSFDIFAAWSDKGKYFQNFTIAGGVSINSVLPSKEGVLMGTRVLLPNSPNDVLEAIYGPSWKIPNPLFRWNRPAHVGKFFLRFITTALKQTRVIGKTTMLARNCATGTGSQLLVSSLLLRWIFSMKAIV